MKLPVAKEGLPYFFALFGASLLTSFFSWTLSLTLGFSSLLVLLFFRDPKKRSIPKEGEILSPSYGTVVEVVEVEEPSFLKQKGIRVGIFLSVFDVHINYAPISGRVTHLKHEKGKFKNALKAEAAVVNECNWVGIQSDQGVILVKQIAGMIARRIVCFLKNGSELQAGEKIGLIQFGSRVDVWLPQGTRICVAKGERVQGGVTVIGIKK